HFSTRRSTISGCRSVPFSASEDNLCVLDVLCVEHPLSEPRKKSGFSWLAESCFLWPRQNSFTTSSVLTLRNAVRLVRPILVIAQKVFLIPVVHRGPQK